MEPTESSSNPESKPPDAKQALEELETSLDQARLLRMLRHNELLTKQRTTVLLQRYFSLFTYGQIAERAASRLQPKNPDLAQRFWKDWTEPSLAEPGAPPTPASRLRQSYLGLLGFDPREKINNLTEGQAFAKEYALAVRRPADSHEQDPWAIAGATVGLLATMLKELAAVEPAGSRPAPIIDQETAAGWDELRDALLATLEQHPADAALFAQGLRVVSQANQRFYDALEPALGIG